MFDCREMFRHACAFAEVADMATEKFEHDTADISWYTTPAAVNSAFACEVYLKSILKYKGIIYETVKTDKSGKKHKKSIHDLKKLFELLPEWEREWVKAAATHNNAGQWYDVFGREILANISQAFTGWRYIYEVDFTKTCSVGIDSGFLTAFRNALREASCQLFFQMTWEEYKQ